MVEMQLEWDMTLATIPPYRYLRELSIKEFAYRNLRDAPVADVEARGLADTLGIDTEVAHSV